MKMIIDKLQAEVVKKLQEIKECKSPYIKEFLVKSLQNSLAYAENEIKSISETADFILKAEGLN